MDSNNKEVNSAGAKSLTPFSIADILSNSSSNNNNNAKADVESLPAAAAVHPYPWFCFGHPAWPLLLPAPASSGAGAPATNTSSSPDNDTTDADDMDDEDGSIIGSITSSNEDTQQDDPIDMRAGQSRSRKWIALHSVHLLCTLASAAASTNRKPKCAFFLEWPDIIYMMYDTRVISGTRRLGPLRVSGRGIDKIFLK